MTLTIELEFCQIAIICALVVLGAFKIFAKLTCGKTDSYTCLVDKTAIVTGGNAGIGYHICLGLASRGARVIIADCADSKKSRNEIIRLTGNRNIVSKHLDLASNESIRSFAEDIKNTEKRLDILVNNAGVPCVMKDAYNKEGVFIPYQINYFGAFLLTHLLVDLLKQSAPSRILFTTSHLAFINNLSKDNFNGLPEIKKSELAIYFAYGNTKLGAVLMADGFAERLMDAGVTANSVNPGSVDTGIFWKGATEGNVLSLRLMYWFIWFWSKSPREGAETALHVCLAKELEYATGKTFVDCKEFIKPKKAHDKKFREEMWKMCEDITKLKPEEKLPLNYK